MVRMMQGRGVHTLIFVFLLSACSSIDLNAARQLSANGNAAASKLYEDADLAVTRTRTWPDREALIVSLSNPGGELPDVTERTSRVADLLTSRARVFGQLKVVYGSFADLVNYNAVTETQNATTSFINEATGFIDAVNKNTNSSLPTISENATSIINAGAGILADEILKQKVKEASVVVRRSLEKVIPAIDAERQWQYAIALRRSFERQDHLLRATLLDQGLASYEETAKEITANVGMQPVKNVDAILASSKNKRQAIEAYLQKISLRREKAIEASYHNQIGLLKALIAEHEKLEQGRPVDSAVIQEWIVKIQAVIDTIKS